MTKTKYQIILDDICQQIEKGELTVGSKLPSIRQLSLTHACSKDTVQRALLELRQRKLIYPIHKSGYYVLEADEQRQHLPLPESEIDSLAYEDFRLCLNETLIGRESYLFNYYHKQEGLEPLIQSVQKLLVESDVYSKPEDLVITTGSQQALYILSQMTFPDGKSDILLEQPTYHRMNDLVREQGLPYQTIERNWDGLDFDRLEAIFKTGRIKFFYTIPRLHNPLASSYSEIQKKKLVQLAQRYQVYIVEDDYLADFDHGHQPPLHYYDTNHRIIYIKSFSAAIFPALRLAAVSLPRPLLKTFLRTKQLMDYDTNLILQKALSLYIDNGMFEKNRLALQTRFRHNQELSQQILTDCRQPTPPYRLLNNKVIFRLDNKQTASRLKTTKLELDWLTNNYIDKKASPYLSLTGRDKLEQVLKLICLDKKNQD